MVLFLFNNPIVSVKPEERSNYDTLLQIGLISQRLAFIEHPESSAELSGEHGMRGGRGYRDLWILFENVGFVPS